MVHRAGVFGCPDCAKTFSRLEYVERHRRLKHLGLRPWSCSACGASYGRSDLLTRHRRKCPSVSLSQQQPSQGVAFPTARSRLTQRNQPANISTEHPHHHPSQLDILGPHHHPAHLPPTYEQATRQSHLTYHPSYSSGPAPPNATGSNQALTTQGSSFLSTRHSEPLDVPPLQKSLPFSQDRSQFVSDRDKDVYRDFGMKPSPLVSDQGFGPFSAPGQPSFLPGHSLDPTQPAFDGFSPVSPEAETDLDDDEIEPVDPQPVFDSPAARMVKFSHPHFFISDEPESSPFYLNPNLWVLAFLCQRAQGFTIPIMGELSRFVRTATEKMLPLIPMIHVPTLRTSVISIHLGYALSVAGAAADASKAAIAFTEQSLSYKRPLVQKDFVETKNSFDFRFELLQTLLTYQFLGIFNRLQAQRRRAVKFGPTMVQNFKDLRLHQVVRDAPDYVQLILSGVLSLDVGWRSWAKYEMYKRTIFLVLISSYHVSRESVLKISDADVRLPCHEDIWAAPTAQEWLKATLHHYDQIKQISSSSAGAPLGSIGEESIPTLTDALRRLSLEERGTEGGSCTNTSPSHVDHAYHSAQLSFTSDQTKEIAQSRWLTENPNRLGGFAQTVLLHCLSLNHERGHHNPSSSRSFFDRLQCY